MKATLAISDRPAAVTLVSSTSGVDSARDEFLPLYNHVTVTVPGTSATSIASTSGQSMVTIQLGPVTVVSAETLQWESAIQGGMRFRYLRSPGVFLVGYGAGRNYAASDIEEGFYDFAGQELPPGELDHVHLASERFPALLGWHTESGVVIQVEGATAPACLEYGVQTHGYWPGWQPEKRVDVITEPTETAHTRGAHEDLVELFEGAREDWFEPDEDAGFDLRLTEIVRQRKDALKILAEILMETDIPSRETAQRAVQVIASHESIGATAEGLGFFATLLDHPLPSMRDSAALGLYQLRMPSALNLLRAAHRKEPSVFVRRNLAQIISALERVSG